MLNNIKCVALFASVFSYDVLQKC